MQARDATNPSPPGAYTPCPTDLSGLRLSYEAVISTLNKCTAVPRLMLYARPRPRSRRFFFFPPGDATACSESQLGEHALIALALPASLSATTPPERWANPEQGSGETAVYRQTAGKQA